MAITFSGEFTSPRPPDEVYDFLCDANKFGPLLPDFESMSVQDATHFTVKVRVGVGNIRGSAELKMELTQAVRSVRAQYQGHGKAVGSEVSISASFDLSPLAEGTTIAWQGEARISGKLASMAGGLLEPLSKKNIQKLIDGLQASISYPPAQAITEPAPTPAVEASPIDQPVSSPEPVPPTTAGKPEEQPPQAAREDLPRPE